MVRIISLKHVQDANVCGEARLSGVPFLGSSVCLWVGHELIPRPALFQFLSEALKTKEDKNAK